MLKENQSFFVACNLVVVLVLLYILVLHPLIYTISGFDNILDQSAGALGFYSVQSGANVASELYSAGATADQNRGGDMGIYNNFGDGNLLVNTNQ
jgi:hypothetical protein